MKTECMPTSWTFLASMRTLCSHTNKHIPTLFPMNSAQMIRKISEQQKEANK